VSPGRPLGATAQAALVLLAFGDASGYELKQRAHNTLRFFFAAPAMSQIYAELARLADAGLVADRYERRGGERETRVFALTDAGHAELRRWLAEDPLPPTVFKSHLALRLVAGHFAAPNRLLADVATERARLVAEVADIRAIVESIEPDDPRFGWARLVAEWGLEYFGGQIGQLDELREAVRTKTQTPAAPSGQPAG
jgi:DNA-binding PadR family transcriptional regulator